ncbi:hypothetical protein WDH52_10335 [Streptomyces sp. TRM70308]
MTEPIPLTSPGIWCECLTRAPHSGELRSLAAYDATTPAQAIR